MAADIIWSDATRLAELIRTREVSPVEVIQAHLDRIAAVNPKVNAIVSVAQTALASAQAAEAAILAGDVLGPLHGVPFTAKDSIDTAGVPTQRGSPVFRDRTPDADATSVARLKAAGGILLAKTNLPEFSYSTESDNLLTGRSNNPWNLERTPGGSSGGESAAIAAGMSPLGLGTDLAISIRGPAAQTGIIGFKPTHGRIPMTGIWPRAPRRFWHVGPMARTVRDVALAYSLLAGPDGADGFSTTSSSYDAGVGAAPTRKLRIGWLVEPGFGPVDPAVASTVQAAAVALRDAGHLVEAVRIPALERDNALDIFLKLHLNEMKPAFVEATAGRPDSDLFKIARGMLASSETPMDGFIGATQGAERMRDGFADYFSRFDALLTPTLPLPAHRHDLSELVIDGQRVPAVQVMGATTPLNVTGLPGLSIRFGASEEGLPIGVQLVAAWHAESTILYLATELEARSPVRDLRPPIA